MTLQDHRKTLGAIFFFLGILQTIALITVFFYYGLDLLLLGYTVLYLLTGWKLHHESSNAKIFAIVASLLCLMSFPIGTAIGVYGLWFTLMRENREEF